MVNNAPHSPQSRLEGGLLESSVMIARQCTISPILGFDFCPYLVANPNRFHLFGRDVIGFDFPNGFIFIARRKTNLSVQVDNVPSALLIAAQGEFD